MGCDVFIDHACDVRPGGDVARLQGWFRQAMYLEIMVKSPDPDGPLRVIQESPEGEREVAYSRADLEAAVGELERTCAACAACPANFLVAHGGAAALGCYARVNYPLDRFAERILHESLLESARPERFLSEQGNLGRAILAAEVLTGQTMARIVREFVAAGRLAGPSDWGARPVEVPARGRNELSVYMLEEYLFFQPRLAPEAVVDALAFFRAFFDVVGRYVSTAGKLDEDKNARFWQRSASLGELNLMVQALRHAASLGAGVVLDG